MYAMRTIIIFKAMCAVEKEPVGKVHVQISIKYNNLLFIKNE